MSLKKHKPVSVSPDQLSELRDAAAQAADAAAKVTGSYFRQPLDVVNKAGNDAFDPVTLADKEAEIAIRKVLLNAFPDIGFYGEEHAVVESSSGLTWVVDPIDGTRAFMSGMPLWGTLIGLFDGERPVMGLMDQPFFAERFIADTNGSELQDKAGTHALQCRTDVPLEQATLYCTTPDMFVSPEHRMRFETVRNTVQLTRYGGDCYAYALVALGHADIVLDCDLKPYDIVALIPIIEAAGGVVSNWEGGSAVDGGYVVASASPALHAQALQMLRP